MFARSYVLQLSDNVKRKFEQKRRNGEWTGKAPIGYKNIGEKGNKDIVPDPQTSHLIVKMFELYASGNHSTLTIRNEITKAGLRSPKGKKLALSMVDHILNNPFYFGEMDCKSKLYPHKYKPLISKELFDRCQRIRKGWGITKDVYDVKLKEYKEKQHDIDLQLEEHTYADENYYITASTVFSLAKRAKELFESSEVEEKRAILNYLLQNCVANGKKLGFSLRSPFNHILEFSKQPTWLPNVGRS